MKREYSKQEIDDIKDTVKFRTRIAESHESLGEKIDTFIEEMRAFRLPERTASVETHVRVNSGIIVMVLAAIVSMAFWLFKS